VNPGFVKTNMSAHNKDVNMMTPEYIAGVIKWIIEQPIDIEIGEIGIWTNTL
jgi:NADP-dependent 3-hydroxy acid dehydrogenase YdfG